MALAAAGPNIHFMTDLSTRRVPTANPTVLQLRRSERQQNTAAVQLTYHGAFPGLLLLLFPSEVICVEVEALQVIFSAVIETISPLCQILPCSSVDAFYLVHQNGFISLRVANVTCSDEKMESKLNYERVCFNDAQRVSSKLRAMGSALCPTTQSLVAVVLNTGKLIFHQLTDLEHSDIEPYRMHSIGRYIQLGEGDLSNSHSSLRISQYGSLPFLSATVTALRVRPMEEEQKRTGDYSASPLDGLHIAAVATSTGTVHLIDVFGGCVVRALQIHSCQIKCLEWGGSDMLITSAYSASLSASMNVRNDIFATDIRTGAKKRLREEVEESPVELLRVSYYHCYLAISFRSDPLEIWDIKSFRLLRRMSRRCPVIVDMAWSGKHHNMKTVSTRSIYRENLVVLDNDNHLYHVVIKGLHVKDGKEVSTQWKSGATLLKCMVWKDDILAFGDSAGRLGVWDLTRSQCRQTGMTQSTRGPVLRCVFSRLAGDSTLAVQHPSSVVLWDTEKLQPIRHYQHSGQTVLDLDTCGATPVYLTSDGMFHHAFTAADGSKRSTVPESRIPHVLKRDFVRSLLEGTLCEDRAQGGIELASTASTSALDKENSIALTERLSEPPNKRERIPFFLDFIGAAAMSQLVELAYAVNGSTARPLQTCLLPYWKSGMYRKRAEQLARVLLSTAATEKQLELAIEKCIVLKRTDLATFSLLNNDQRLDPLDFRLNAFKACLLSADLSSEECRCLVKLTATNMIASDSTSDGIQLLFLIDQGLDACRYLLSQGQWEKALAASKMNPSCDSEEILSKYIEHLEESAASEPQHRAYAAKLFLAKGDFDKFIQIAGEFVDDEVSKLYHLVVSDALEKR